MFSAPKFKNNKVHLNLLYPQGIPQQLHLRLFKWVLSFGRYIAVFVEIIVLVAFAARFKLDADLASINDQINTQVPFLEASVKDEDLIKQIQFKTDYAKQALSQSPKWSDILTKITNQIPPTITFTVLTFDKIGTGTNNFSFKITGRSPTNSDLEFFVIGLKSEPLLKDIDLVNISFDEGALIFTISGATK